MTLNEMYRHAKAHVDSIVQRWDGGDLWAEYAMRGDDDKKTAKHMLREWRNKRDELINFKQRGFKESS